MKKLFVLALALALMLSGSALAEAFVLENGVAWGMTQGDVLAIEGAGDVEYETVGIAEELDVDDTAFRGAEADADYLFRDDALAAVVYELDAEDVTPQALAEALDGEYGARGAGNEGHFCDLMSALTGRTYAMSAILRTWDFYYDWTGPGGTYVALTNRFSNDEDDFYVCFFDEAGLLAGSDAFLSEPAPALEP